MATVHHLVGAQDGCAAPVDRAQLRDEARPDQRDDRHVGFGAWLRRARKARGLTLDDISRRTKIPQRHLEALEQGNLSILPEFYQRAEVRAFAREVGADEQVALALLHAIATPVEPPREVSREAPRELAQHEHPAIYVALALSTVFVTGILTAALFVWAMAGRTLTSEGAGGTRSGVAAGRSKDLPLRRTAGADRSEELPLRVSTPGDPVATATDSPAAAGVVTDLIITTQPAGARVTVNGIGWGMSPVTIHHLPAGDKRIRVSKDGYAAAERVLALDGGPRRALDIRLTTASQR